MTADQDRKRLIKLLERAPFSAMLGLKIESADTAWLELDDKPPEKITEMHLEGVGFTGTSTGVIESPDARRAAANTLKLKLIPHQEMLMGRILATAGDPNIKNVMLPYTLSLNRVPA